MLHIRKFEHARVHLGKIGTSFFKIRIELILI